MEASGEGVLRSERIIRAVKGPEEVSQVVFALDSDVDVTSRVEEREGASGRELGTRRAST
jgi:hypothetical protein